MALVMSVVLMARRLMGSAERVELAVGLAVASLACAGRRCSPPGWGSCRGQGHACGLSGERSRRPRCVRSALRRADFSVVGQVKQQVTAVVDNQVQRFKRGCGATGFLIVGQVAVGGWRVSQKEP